jgi:twitching motility protein PilT
MAAGTAPASIAFEWHVRSGENATDGLLAAMLRAHDQVSDLIFSPGRVPQIEIHGQLAVLEGPGVRPLTPDDTRRIASDLIGSNKQAIAMLRDQGSCDISYGLPGLARFRVNVFIQRGSCAVVIRVIPTMVPELASLGLPRKLEQVPDLSEGLVLITGPRNSGKSSTMAALVDRINSQRLCHIVTIEDPIEFLHLHKTGTVHQRELHSDTPSMPMALQAALRQAPNVIQVSEVRDRETMEMVLEAAETGHLVFASFNTADAVKTIERILGLFGANERPSVRSRLSRMLRVVVSQRLLQRKDGNGRVAAAEILTINPQVREVLEEDDFRGERLLEAMRNGASDGMQELDCAIKELVCNGTISVETALLHASNPERLRTEILS